MRRFEFNQFDEGLDHLLQPWTLCPVWDLLSYPRLVCTLFIFRTMHMVRKSGH